MIRRIVLAIVGFALGGLCLWLSTRSVDWREAVRIFRSADAAGLATGIGLFAAAAVLRALRWRTIIAFRTRLSMRMSLQALLAGYAVNSVLPARLGEIFRAHYLGRRAGVSRPGALASIVIERLLDLVTVIGSLAAGLALAGGGDSASRHVLFAGAALAGLAVVLLLALAWLLSQRSAKDWLLLMAARVPAGDRIARRLGGMLGDFTQALQVVRTRHFLVAVLLTFPIWILEACAMWSVCCAIGVTLDLTAMLSLLGGASLSTLVPTAPGYVGSYQIAFVVILGQFGVGPTLAIVGATAVQVYLIGTLTLVGLAILAVDSVASAVKAARRPPL